MKVTAWVALVSWLFVSGTVLAQTQQEVYLDEMELDKVEVGWRSAIPRKNLEGDPLLLSGKIYERGICTHARMTGTIVLDKNATAFTAVVGLDDRMAGRAFGSTVVMDIYLDGALAISDTIKPGAGGKAINVDLKGKSQLSLSLIGKDGNTNHSHFNWADARISYAGAKPYFFKREREAAYILTPKAGPKPKINGALVYGVRPNSPVLYQMAVTGDRPMTYGATGLPVGVSLDARTGRITGRISTAGSYAITLTAANAKGKTSAILKIECGEKFCLTPPMGWNSWNAWGMSVSPEKVKAAADAMVSKGLINYGYTYVNIDDGWQGKREGKDMALQPDERFRDMKGLSSYVHAKGLKLGIYSTPWLTSFGNRVGGSMDDKDGSRYNAEGVKGRRMGVYPMHEPDARQWAEWEIDYLKYDWGPIDVPHTMAMSKALLATNRDIVFSLSNSADYRLATEFKKYAHLWRTTGDIIDTWGSLEDIGFSQDRWSPHAEPGNWNDPDMLILGRLGWGTDLHDTRLTPNEQYTHMTHWCMLAAPLLLGCDLSTLDDFTLNLLTNTEVLAINQDPLGKAARRIYNKDRIQVWKRTLADGSSALAVYNLSDVARDVNIPLVELGYPNAVKLRDLWRQQDLKPVVGSLTLKQLPIHGCMMYKASAAK